MAIYKSCDWIEHGIVFDQCNIVRACCIYNSDYVGRPEIWRDYMGSCDWQDLFRIKKAQREHFQNGGYISECTDCIELKTKNWDDSDYIDRIILTPWIECNSKCIYCSPTDSPELINTKKYNVTKVISSMIENNVLLKTAIVDFAGGEPTMYEDFEELLSLFINNGFNDIIINSSAIKYSSSIENGISKGIIRLLVSIDAGTKEMHQTIKGVDSYEQVWANLAKYIQAQKNNTGKVKAKYIIVPEVNDSENQIDIWLNKCLSIGLNSVVLNLDHNWVTANLSQGNLIPAYNLMTYTINRAKELNIKLELFPQINQIKYKVEEMLNLECREA